MKHWPYIAILVIALCGVGLWIYQQRETLGLAHFFGENSGTDSTGSITDPSSVGSLKPARIQWHTVNQSADGFKVDLPAGSENVEAPANNESGSTEPVKMLRSSPDGDTVYAVTWQDNPPVARVNSHDPDRTLDQARDGMLAGTQATLVSETRINVNGFPGREVFAQNSAGGILNVRLIYVPANGPSSVDRLYTLMALFPTAGARSEKDVTRFFSSFQPQQPATRG